MVSTSAFFAINFVARCLGEGAAVHVPGAEALFLFLTNSTIGSALFIWEAERTERYLRMTLHEKLHFFF
jgi:hypothetical protein